MTSIAPLRVAGLIEFHVLVTDPPQLLTYCIFGGREECQRSTQQQRGHTNRKARGRERKREKASDMS